MDLAFDVSKQKILNGVRCRDYSGDVAVNVKPNNFMMQILQHLKLINRY